MEKKVNEREENRSFRAFVSFEFRIFHFDFEISSFRALATFCPASVRGRVLLEREGESLEIRPALL